MVRQRNSLLIVFTFAALSFIAWGIGHPEQWVAAWKALPIWALALWVYSNAASFRSRLVVFGLLVGSVGDVLMHLNLFTAGLGAFLIGHLLYIGAFGRHFHFAGPRLLLAILTAVATAAVYWFWFAPALGAMQQPVMLYMIVIGAMAVSAVLGMHNHWLIFIGALLFLFSDTLIGLGKFAPEHLFVEKTKVQQWIMLSYYSSQLLIAWGTLSSRWRM